MKSLCSASQPGVFAVMALLATSYVRADVTGERNDVEAGLGCGAHGSNRPPMLYFSAPW